MLIPPITRLGTAKPVPIFQQTLCVDSDRAPAVYTDSYALDGLGVDSDHARGGRLDAIPRAERRWRLDIQRSSGTFRRAEERAVEDPVNHPEHFY